MTATNQASSDPIDKVTSLFGGAKALHHRVNSSLDAHELILKGLPTRAVLHFADRLLVLNKSDSLTKAIGMSLRTFQRRKSATTKPLSSDQSGRTWQFAELLAKAIDVFGTQEAAEHWFEAPAMALDNRRPIDLLETPAGRDVLRDHLTRLEYGVYA